MADRSRDTRRPGTIRHTDVEPYPGLKWVSYLFKAAAIFLFVALVGEFVAGLRYDGLRHLPALLGDAARTLVVAVVLWSGGDLVRLLVHIGHDIRAQRVLLARVASRMPAFVNRPDDGAGAGDEVDAPDESGAPTPQARGGGSPEAAPARRGDQR
jgi:hypothetical protein